MSNGCCALLVKMAVMIDSIVEFVPQKKKKIFLSCLVPNTLRVP